ncbi:MAG: hypothetical protein ABI406_09750 [Ktedonobacteraceae bacterium]
MLSAAKHLTVRRAMLRCTQHDSQHGAMKRDRAGLLQSHLATTRVRHYDETHSCGISRRPPVSS